MNPDVWQPLVAEPQELASTVILRMFEHVQQLEQRVAELERVVEDDE